MDPYQDIHASSKKLSARMSYRAPSWCFHLQDELRTHGQEVIMYTYVSCVATETLSTALQGCYEVSVDAPGLNNRRQLTWKG